MKPSPLRDLVRQLETVAREHPAFSQAYKPVQVCLDHLSAMARIEELQTEAGQHRE